MRALVIVHC